jgi:hypothetical protein
VPDVDSRLQPEDRETLASLRQKLAQPPEDQVPKILTHAIWLHRRAAEILPSREDETTLPNVLAALKTKRTCCPRILLRTDDVKRTVTYLQEKLPHGIAILSLSTDMTARARERSLTKFKGADGQQAKMKVLRRSVESQTLQGRAKIVFELWGGEFLDVLESHLVFPKIMVVDGAGNKGLDLHLFITALISNQFLHTLDEIVQFCGRSSRCAPLWGAQPKFTLQMCVQEGTLEETLYLPAVRAEEEDARDGGGAGPRM